MAQRPLDPTTPGAAPAVGMRLPGATLERLDRLAAQRGVKRPVVLREAVEAYLSAEEAVAS